MSGAGSSITSGGGGGGGSGGGGPCGACKVLRRKCVAGCIFAPYFDSEQGAVHFATVHKVFGATELSYLQGHLASLEVPTPPPPPLQPQPPTPSAGFSNTNLPITSSLPANYDLSVLFDPMVQSSARSMQSSARQMAPIQCHGSDTSTPPQHDGGRGSSSDLHDLARELLQRQNTGSSDVTTLPPHDSI
ncbi:LOB domain-containing protein 18-like [Bidens hawaiensis]|uniref:LOB domain-containing protein 18-like n=1 Tax=Bidens hawaiensis TaxID=980011 RepID=UPI004049ECDC